MYDQAPQDLGEYSQLAAWEEVARRLKAGEMVGIDEHTHHERGLTSERRAQYRERDLRVQTTYRFWVEDQELRLHASVNDAGEVVCHGVPYTTFTSALDVLRSLVDLYPEEFGLPSPQDLHDLEAAD